MGRQAHAPRASLRKSGRLPRRSIRRSSRGFTPPQYYPMPQQGFYPPQYYPAGVVTPPHKGEATAALTLGIVGAVFGLIVVIIPVALIVSIPCGVLALGVRMDREEARARQGGVRARGRGDCGYGHRIRAGPVLVRTQLGSVHPGPTARSWRRFRSVGHKDNQRARSADVLDPALSFASHSRFDAATVWVTGRSGGSSVLEDPRCAERLYRRR